MRHRRRILWSTITAIGVSLVSGGVCGIAAAQSAERDVAAAVSQDKEDASAQLMDRIFAQLDSASFHVRQQAFADIERLVEADDLAAAALERIVQRLSAAETSADVRLRLRSLWDERPFTEYLSARPYDAAETSAVIRELQSDRYSVRAAAEFRLQLACAATDQPAALFIQLKQAVSDAPDTQSRQMLMRLNERLRVRWLQDEHGNWEFPPVDPHVIEETLNVLVAESVASSSQLRCDQAEQALIDMLLQPSAYANVCAQLQLRLKDGQLADGARLRIERILELTRHMVAIEFWESPENSSRFELVPVTPNSATDLLQAFVAPPERKPGTVVTGVNDGYVTIEQSDDMPAGTYPLGQFYFGQDANVPILQIVDLATPKQHLLHRLSHTHMTFADRMHGVSERTIDAWLERNQHLDQYERTILFVLDAEVVSVKAPQLLLALDDVRQKQPERFSRAGARSSHHHEICHTLAMNGRAAAADGILAAIKAGKILAPIEEDDPFDWPTVALFSIAGRDPWAEADQWLAAQLTSDHKLRIGEKDDRGWNSPQPSARAAAAWLLLKQRGADPEDERFGLKTLRFDMLEDVGCPSCSFQSEEAYHATLEWLKQSQTAAGPGSLFP